jgi:hypothetical protein
MSHNEVYNMPYSGMSIGYGWGSNDAGGSNHYANRGLYNYQPRYTTPTTATNNRLIGNYIHDVMQQMTDGGCIYTLGWNPGGQMTGNHCLRTNGWFGLYFDEGSKYYTASNNVFDAVGTWATANWWGGENMGNFTVTNNWASNSNTNVTNGDRGNVVNNNVTVTNGNWPAGAQAVKAAAGPQGGSTPQGSRLVGTQSGRCIEVVGAATGNGAQTQLADCTGAAHQTWTYMSGKQLTVYGGTKCLDANGQGAGNGTAVIIWDCHGQANQQWNVNANGTVTGVQSGLCLDVSGAGTANGSKINLWSCHGGTNQQWTLR